MTHDPTIVTQHLTTGYISSKGEKIVARDVNETVYSGELTCLLGPNGAGKSTLLKTLSAFIPPIAGNVVIAGRPLSEYSETDLAKVIGVVLTDRIDISNLSVYDMVALGRSPYTGFWGRLQDNDRNAVEWAMDFMNVSSMADRMVHTLSDGERQKVMIAKALAQETPVIFLDEPTAFLDYPSKVEIMQSLHDLSRKVNKTVFMSTHDLEIALQIADRVWLIDKNIGVAAGTPEDLAVSGDLERFFRHEGIKFDNHDGIFKIAHRIHGKIGVKGENPDRVNMVAKALLRNGLETSSDANGEGIEVLPDGYTYGDVKVATVGELLRILTEAGVLKG